MARLKRRRISSGQYICPARSMIGFRDISHSNSVSERNNKFDAHKSPFSRNQSINDRLLKVNKFRVLIDQESGYARKKLIW